MGITLFWPPYILRPLTRLAKWTLMRRTPISTNVTSTIITSATSSTARSVSHGVRLVAWKALRIRVVKPVKRLEMIPAKISSEMPLPRPFSVMRSPIHMARAVPPAMLTPTSTVLNQPLLM